MPCNPQFYCIKVGFKGVKIFMMTLNNENQSLGLIETHHFHGCICLAPAEVELDFPRYQILRKVKVKMYFDEVRGDFLQPPYSI